MSRLGFGHRLAVLAVDVLLQALVLFVCVWVVDAVARPHGWTARIAALVVLAALGYVSWRRSRVPLDDVERELELRDGLRTWRVGARPGPMREWLARSIDARLATLEGADEGSSLVRRLWPLRRRLKPLTILVPLWIVVLVLRALAPTPGFVWPEIEVPIPVVVAVPGETPNGADDSESVEDTNDAPAPGDAPPDPGEPPPDEPESDPVPLIERPHEDRFVIPSFIASEGTSRPGEAHVAEVGEDAGQAYGAPQGGDAAAADPPPEDVTFERAIERALANRHVAERDRELVRQYFRMLLDRQR